MTQEEFDALTDDQKIINWKAQVYDFLAQRQLIDQNINNINAEIGKLSQKQTPMETTDGINEISAE